MAVLHLVSDTARRGAQVFAVQLAANLDTLGVPGTVAALERSDDEAGLDVEVLPGSWRARGREMAAYDLVVAHGSTTLAAATVCVPGNFIYRSIGDPSYWLSTAARRAKVGLSLRAAKAVVALYPAAATALQELAFVPEKRIHVIPNGVVVGNASTSPTPLLTGAGRHVLYVGALSWEKQVDHLIEAVARLDDTGLVCVGAGPQRSALEEQARALLPGRALFPGAIDDPWPYYESCDCLALTSITEGMPGCVLEAALAGRATCSYDIGGISHMILDRQTGRIVPSNRKDDFSDALAFTLDHGRSLGTAAREHVQNLFDMNQVARSWADLIADLG